MKRIMTIGGATYDTIIKYSDPETLNLHSGRGTLSYLLLEEGKKIEITELQKNSGGGATNSAVAFKRLGFTVDIFCKVGDDLIGDKIIDELKAHEINTNLIRKHPDLPTASSFIIPSLKGDRTVFAHRGANIALAKSELPLSAILKTDLLYITSLSGESSEQLPELTQFAQENNIPVAINPGISQLKGGGAFIARSLENIDMLLLNSEEAKQLMVSLLREALGREAPKKPANLLDMPNYPELLFQAIYHEEQSFSLYEFFHTVLDLGPRIVVVTHGHEGVYVGTKDAVYFHEAIASKTINTIGAGDAFSSSFVAATLCNKTIPDAIRWGIVNSASVISFNDAKEGLLNQDAVVEKISELPSDYLHQLPLTIE